VLSMLADEMGVFLGTRTVAEVRSEMGTALAARQTAGSTPSSTAKGEPATVPQPGPGQFVLATWRHLLDRGSLQDGEPFLAGTAPTPKALLSPVSAEAIGVVPGDLVTVTADGVRVTAPAQIVEMVDHVVWLPTNSESCDLRSLAASRAPSSP
jgi:NADH-quinone oxidoreductase subunit G